MKNQTKNYRNFRTFMDSKIRHFARFPTTNYSGQELHNLLNEILKVHNSFYPTLKAEVHIAGWRGKTNLEIVPKIDSIDVIRYRKKHKFATPQPFVLNIPHKSFDNMLIALRNISHYKTKLIKTEEIAAEYCRISGITENKKGEPLFNESGFIWSNFFGFRILHVTTTEQLNILDKYGLIEYLKGYTNIIDLNKKLDFQTKFVT